MYPLLLSRMRAHRSRPSSVHRYKLRGSCPLWSISRKVGYLQNLPIPNTQTGVSPNIIMAGKLYESTSKLPGVWPQYILTQYTDTVSESCNYIGRKRYPSVSECQSLTASLQQQTCLTTCHPPMSMITPPLAQATTIWLRCHHLV